MLLEKQINCQLAILKNRPKKEVQERYLEYITEWDKKGDKTTLDKQEHRDFFYRYLRYMSGSGK
jgi:hypothetical protein